MEFSAGDIVANKFGHILCIHRTEEDFVLAFYECNPTVLARYNPEELRLLSKTQGVNMGVWNSSDFAAQIKRSMEWAKGVHGLPRKYREAAPKQKKLKLNLAEMSDEQLQELLKSIGETVPETKEEEHELARDVGEGTGLVKGQD